MLACRPYRVVNVLPLCFPFFTKVLCKGIPPPRLVPDIAFISKKKNIYVLSQSI